MTLEQLLRERTKVREYLATVLVLLLAVVLLFVVHGFAGRLNPTFAEVVREVGITLFVIGGLHFLWEIASKKAFMEEVFLQVNSGRDLQDAGVARISRGFQHIQDWPALFDRSSTLDVLVAYARTWRHANLTNLRNFVNRGGKLRVLLPDPRDTAVLSALAHRFNKTSESMRVEIDEAIDEFSGLHQSVEVVLVSTAPVFSAYVFEGIAVVVPYHHGHERADVPTFVLTADGFVFQHVRTDLDGLLRDGKPAPKPTTVA